MDLWAAREPLYHIQILGYTWIGFCLSHIWIKAFEINPNAMSIEKVTSLPLSTSGNREVIKATMSTFFSVKRPGVFFFYTYYNVHYPQLLDIICAHHE